MRKKFIPTLVVTASATGPIWARMSNQTLTSASENIVGPEIVPPGRIIADCAGSRSEDDIIVVAAPALIGVAPVVDGVFKTAHHGKTECGDAGGQPVNRLPRGNRYGLQGSAHGLAQRIAVVLPVARHKFAQPIEHGACGTQSKGRQHGIPRQYAEHMAMRCRHRVLNHLADNLAAGQILGINLLPAREKGTCQFLITLLQRIPYASEMVTELPESQRRIENDHVPDNGHRPAQRDDQNPMHNQRNQRGHQNGKTPGEPAVRLLPCIKIPGRPPHPNPNIVVHQIAAGQRPRLLNQQGYKNGKKAHVNIITSRSGVRPTETGRNCGACLRWRPR